jgi:hypothetical protein
METKCSEASNNFLNFAMVSLGKVFGSKQKKTKRGPVVDDDSSQPTATTEASVISPLRQLLDGT